MEPYLISSNPLDILIERETFAEIVALLEPQERVIADLRVRGRSDAEIAELLGQSRSTISRWMRAACQRIMEQNPDLAPALQDRGRSHRFHYTFNIFSIT